MIKLDYENALEKAKKLEEAAGWCDNQATALAQTEENLAAAWVGDSGTQMLEKYQTWVTEQKKIAEDLRTLAVTIRSTATDIWKKDQEIANKIRTSGGGGSGAYGGDGSMGSR